ncbi:MAG: SIS domain-containing protein [Candidatus Aminicenantia bacterium]
MIDWENLIEETEDLKREFFQTKREVLSQAIKKIEQALSQEKKVIVFGNGGSAAQAQHFAAELVNKYFKKRKALPALALTTDSSVLTSIGNDISFDEIFSRQIEALGNKSDVAIGISTSGNSPNVIKGIQKAREKGLLTVGLTGDKGGELASKVDVLIDVPSTVTPRIQEIHLLVLHLIAEELEKGISESSS